MTSNSFDTLPEVLADASRRPEARHQPAWGIPIPGRALRRQNPTAAISLFSNDQNASQNQTLARRTPVTLGKYSLPLPCMLLHGKRGDPYS
jgi:hypothetical protein